MIEPPEERVPRCRKEEDVLRQTRFGVNQFEEFSVVPGEVNPRSESNEIVATEIDRVRFVHGQDIRVEGIADRIGYFAGIAMVP